MIDPTYFRGGPTLNPHRFEVKFDRTTGKVLPRRGVSVSTRTDGLARFGGAFEVTSIPPELRVVQIGKDPFHHEIIPVVPMTFEEYADFLSRIGLVKV